MIKLSNNIKNIINNRKIKKKIIQIKVAKSKNKNRKEKYPSFKIKNFKPMDKKIKMIILTRLLIIMLERILQINRTLKKISKLINLIIMRINLKIYFPKMTVIMIQNTLTGIIMKMKINKIIELNIFLNLKYINIC